MSYSSWWSYSPKSEDIVKIYNEILRIHEQKIFKYDEKELDNIKDELGILLMNQCGELPALELDEYGYVISLKGEKVGANA